MAQRKKKPTSHEQHAVANAQHKNEFFRKLRFLFKAYSGEDLYPLIPHNILENLYLMRCYSFKVVPAKDQVIPPELLNDLRKYIPVLATRETIQFSDNGPEITVHDCITIGFTMIRLSNSIDTVNFPHVKKIETALAELHDPIIIFQRLGEKFYKMLQTYGYFCSDIGKTVYWLKHVVEQFADEDGMQNLIIVNKQVAETISIVIDGNKRPVTRLGWPDSHYEFDWSVLKPSDLNIYNAVDDRPMNVYVQSHALLRLEERVDGINTGILHLNLYTFLRKPVVCYDYNHQILIEYQIFNTKVGYLRADIVDGKVIIRTFLFITQSGTPEGQLLNKNTGLKMLDKKYLAIDKLSTFMNSDIGKNEKVRKIFQDAGCDCLLDSFEKIGNLSFKHANQSFADMMLNYLQYDKQLIPETEEEQVQLSADATLQEIN